MNSVEVTQGQVRADVPATDGERDPRPLNTAASGMLTMGLPIVPPEADEMTVGVAVEVPDPWAERLQQARADFGDPVAWNIPVHITLLPPTVVPRADLEEISVHLARVALKLTSFSIVLDGTDTFRPVSPVVFVRVTSGSDACDELQGLIRSGPLRRNLSFPYHPHVTVAHHLDDEALDTARTTLAEFSAEFDVSGFGLFEHGADGVWRQRRRFPFGDGRT
jgi:2'-5' RNA ligase